MGWKKNFKGYVVGEALNLHVKKKEKNIGVRNPQKPNIGPYLEHQPYICC